MKAVFVITSDPRTSHRPAEAIRIAAGVCTWKKVDVSVYLFGEARRILDDATGEFVDEEHLTRYLPMLQEGKIFAHKDEDLDYRDVLEKIFTADSVQVW